MTLRHQTELQELVDLDTDQYLLTDWESELIDSLDKQVRGVGPKGAPVPTKSLTGKQEHILSAIWDAVYIHGKRNR